MAAGNITKTRAKSSSSIRNPLPIRLSYGRSCAAKLPPASVTCKFSRAACDEIDHVCNRTCRDWAGHCLCLVAHGKSKRKRCDELVNGDCALQVRRLVGVR